MPKAILELEMPESCLKCPCSWLAKDDIRICGVIMHYCPEEGRHKYCPLKLVDADALEKQIPQKVVETPDKHKYGYCPVCGRIYWDKSHVGNYCDQCGQALKWSD